MPRDERGQAAGVEAVAFGLLVLVVGALLFGSAWAVVDTKLTVVASAREAAQAAVESPSLAAAQEAVALVADGAAVELRVGDGFRRCARIEVRVTRAAPAVSLPWLGGLGAVDVSATHSAVVDPFREGIDDPGAVRC